MFELLAAGVQEHTVRNPNTDWDGDEGDELPPDPTSSPASQSQPMELVPLSVVLLSGELVTELLLPASACVGDVLSHLEGQASVGSWPMELQLLLEDRVLCEEDTLEKLGLFLAPPRVATLQLVKLSPKIHYKLMLVGDTFSGKTNIFRCFEERPFTEAYVPTSTLHCSTKALKLKCGYNIELDIWDTPGSDWHRRCVYFRQASAIIIVFDLTNRASFLALHRWLDRISEERGDVLVCIVGSKADCSMQRQVQEEHALRFAASRGHLYRETSAKTSCGIDIALHDVSETLMRRGLTG